MAWLGAEVTVTASAQKLSTALGLEDITKAQEIVFTTLAAGAVYIGPSTLTATTNRRGAVAGANVSYKLGPFAAGGPTLGELYFIGTLNDKLLVSVTTV